MITLAATAARAAAGPPHLFYVIAAIVAVPPVLWLGHKLGDLVPFLLAGAVFGVVTWLGPLVPRSPLACTRPGGHCPGSSGGTIALAELLLPGLVIVIYKAVRGDKRGSNGRRLP